ncbi:MAG: DUF1648 domain-containing protein [Acidobacteriota bacterium]|nr:DUF1648 domain-containing protein [Acidobacteriota bacterium]
MSNTLFLLLPIDLILLLCFMYMPVMRGADAFFGVRVTEEILRGEGRRILRRYWFWLALTFIEIEAIGLIVSLFRGRNEFGEVAPRLLVLPAAMLFYVIFYKQAKRLEVVEEGERFASSLKTRRLRDYTNLALEVVVIALTIAPVLVLIYYYPALPERLPTHWDWKGDPDQWTRKSYFSVFSLGALLIYLQGLLLTIKHGLLGVKMTLPAEHTEEYLRLKEEMLGTTLTLMDRVRLSLGILLGGLTANIAFSAIDNLRFLSKITAIAVWASTALMIVAVAYAIYSFYKSDRRLREEVGRVYVQRQRDAKHWYLGGLIYYNPDDPSLWVEKLMGWGYTFNMGNRWVYVYLAIMTAVPLLLILPLERVG